MPEYDRTVVAEKFKSWLGCKESDGSHKPIIDIYNTLKPLPRKYKVKYTDAWCATAYSAAFKAVGYEDICPSECGCANMITKAKKMGIWQENDAYVPDVGDGVLYDWNDDGVGDNTGNPEHVGMVIGVDGNTITVIEGNYSDSVKERKIAIDGKYIRGFVTPKFTTKSTVSPVAKEEPAVKVNPNRKVAYAKSYDKSIAGDYVTTAHLNCRVNAGKAYASQVVIPKGTTVKNYGYYTNDWLYVVAVVKGIKYDGYCSSKYLKKV